MIENESEYAAVVPPENFTLAVVVEDVPSHCDFSVAETVAAWESLRAWVAGAPQPTAQTIQATCEGLVAGGLATGECRIDPSFVVPDLNDRVRPRVSCNETNTAVCLNDRFLVEVEWQDFQGNTGSGRATGLRTATPARSSSSAGQRGARGQGTGPPQQHGNFWVFYGSLTNVGFEITVTDTERVLQKTYTNSTGSFASIGDTSAF